MCYLLLLLSRSRNHFYLRRYSLSASRHVLCRSYLTTRRKCTKQSLAVCNVTLNIAQRWTSASQVPRHSIPCLLYDFVAFVFMSGGVAAATTSSPRKSSGSNTQYPLLYRSEITLYRMYMQCAAQSTQQRCARSMCSIYRGASVKVLNFSLSQPSE